MAKLSATTTSIVDDVVDDEKHVPDVVDAEFDKETYEEKFVPDVVMVLEAKTRELEDVKETKVGEDTKLKQGEVEFLDKDGSLVIMDANKNELRVAQVTKGVVDGKLGELETTVGKMTTKDVMEAVVMVSNVKLEATEMVQGGESDEVQFAEEDWKSGCSALVEATNMKEEATIASETMEGQVEAVGIERILDSELVQGGLELEEQDVFGGSWQLESLEDKHDEMVVEVSQVESIRVSVAKDDDDDVVVKGQDDVLAAHMMKPRIEHPHLKAHEVLEDETAIMLCGVDEKHGGTEPEEVMIVVGGELATYLQSSVKGEFLMKNTPLVPVPRVQTMDTTLGEVEEIEATLETKDSKPKTSFYTTVEGEFSQVGEETRVAKLGKKDVCLDSSYVLVEAEIMLDQEEKNCDVMEIKYDEVVLAKEGETSNDSQPAHESEFVDEDTMLASLDATKFEIEAIFGKMEDIGATLEQEDSQVVTLVVMDLAQDALMIMKNKSVKESTSLATPDILGKELKLTIDEVEIDVPRRLIDGEATLSDEQASMKDWQKIVKGDFFDKDVSLLSLHELKSEVEVSSSEVNETNATFETKDTQALTKAYGDVIQDVKVACMVEPSIDHPHVASQHTPKYKASSTKFLDVVDTTGGEVIVDSQATIEEKFVIEGAPLVSIHSPEIDLDATIEEEEETVGKDSEATIAATTRVQGEFAQDELEMIVANSSNKDEYMESSSVIVEAEIISSQKNKNYNAMKTNYEEALVAEGEMVKDSVVIVDSEFVVDNLLASQDETKVELDITPDDVKEIGAIMEQEGSQVVIPQDGLTRMEDASVEGSTSLCTQNVLQSEKEATLSEGVKKCAPEVTTEGEAMLPTELELDEDSHMAQEGNIFIECTSLVSLHAPQWEVENISGQVDGINATSKHTWKLTEANQEVTEDVLATHMVDTTSGKVDTTLGELMLVHKDNKYATLEAMFEDVVPTVEGEFEKDLQEKQDNELSMKDTPLVSIHPPRIYLDATLEEEEEIGASLIGKDSEVETTTSEAKLLEADRIDAILVECAAITRVQGEFVNDGLEMIVAESSKRNNNYNATKPKYEEAQITEEGEMVRDSKVAADNEFTLNILIASLDTTKVELDMGPDDVQKIGAMMEQQGSQTVMPQDGKIIMEDAFIEGSTSLSTQNVLQGEEMLDLNEGDMYDSQTLTYVGVQDTQDVPVTCVTEPSLGYHYLVTNDVLEVKATMLLRGKEENVPSTETKFAEVVVENRGKSSMDLHVSQEGEFVIDDAPSVPVYARENDSYGSPGEVEEIGPTTEAKECEQMVADETKLDQPQEVDASLVELYSTTSITVEGDFTQDVSEIVLPESSKKHTSFESLKMPDEAELVLVQEDKKYDTVEAIFEDVIPTTEDELEKDLHGKPDNELVIEEASSVSIHSPRNVTLEEKEEIGSSLACKDSEKTTAINGKLHGQDNVDATLVGVEGQYSHDKLEMTVAEPAKGDEYVDSSVVMVEANIISTCTEENYAAVKATYEDSVHTEEGKMAKDLVVARDYEFVEDNVASMDATEVELNMVPDDTEEICAMTEQEGSQIVMPQDGQILMEDVSIERSTSLATETVLQGEEALDLNEGDMCDSQTLTYVGVEDTQDVPVTCVMEPSLGCHYLVTRDVLEDEATMMLRGEEENVPSTETNFAEVIVENRGKSAMDLHVSQEGEFVIEDAPSIPVYARENDSYATPGEVEEIEATTEAKECEQMVAEDTKLDQPQEVDASLVELYCTTSITVEGDFTQDVSEIVLPESSKKHTSFEYLKMPDEAELVLIQEDKKCDTVEAIFEDVIPTTEDELEKDLHGKPDNELVIEEASSVSIHSPGNVTQEKKEEIGSSLACKDSEATTAINAKLRGLDMVDATLVGVEGQYSHDKLEMAVAESAKEDEYVDSSVVMVEANIISACTEENYNAVTATYEDSLHTEEGKEAKDLVVAHDSEFVEDNVASMDATEVELNMVPDDAEEIRAMTEQEGSQIVMPQDGQILMEDASIEGSTSLATKTVRQGEKKLDLNEGDTSDSQTQTYVGVEDTQDVLVTCVMQPSLGCHYWVTRDVLEDEATIMLREEEENVPSTETKFAEVIVQNRGKSAMDLHVSQEGEFVIEDAPSVPVYARENDSYATPGEVEEIEATTEAKDCEQMVADDTKLDQPQEVDASLVELYSTTSITVEEDFTQDVSEIVLPESSKKHTIYESLKMPDEAELVLVQEDKKCDTVEAIFEDVIPTAEDELEKDLHRKPDNELVIEEASSVSIHSPGNVTQEEKDEIGSSLACKESEATTAINAKLHGLNMADATLVGVEGQYSNDKLEMTVAESAKEDEYVDSSVVMVEANIISACTEENYDAVKATYEDSVHTEEGMVAKDLVVAHDSKFVEDNVASMDAIEVDLNSVPGDAEEIRAMTEQEGSQIVMPQDGQILMEDASIEESTPLATETVLQGEEVLDLNEGDMCDSQTLTYVGVEDTQDVPVTCVMEPSLGCHYLVTRDVLEDEATMMLRGEEENVPSTETNFAKVIVENRGKSSMDLHVSQEGEFVIEDAPSIPVYARENDSYATPGEVEEIEATTEAKECEQMVAEDTKLDQPQEVDASLVELYSTTSITVEGDFTQDVSEIVLPESSKKHTSFESLKMPNEAELAQVQEDKKCDTVEAIFEDVIPTAEDELEKDLHGKPDNELVTEGASSVSIHSPENVTQEEKEEIGSSLACKDSEATTAINAKLHGLDMADATLVGVEGQYSHDKLEMTVAESAKEDEYVDSSVVMVEANNISACTEENYDAVKATYKDSLHTEEGKVAKDLVVAHDNEFVEDNVASMDATEVDLNIVPDDAEEIRAMTEQERSQIVMPQDGQILMEDASIEGSTSLATETVLQGEEKLDLNEGDTSDSQTLTYVGVEDTQDVLVTCVMQPSLGCHYLVTHDVLEDEATMMLREEEKNVPSTETKFAEVIVQNRGKSAMDLHVSQEGEFVIEDAPSIPVYARENDSYATPGEVEEIEATTEAKECEQMVADDTKLDQPQEVDASLVELYSTTSITVEGNFTQDVSEIVLPESSKKHTIYESLKMPDEAELVLVQEDKKCDTVEAIFEDVIPTAEDELEKDLHFKPDNELVIEEASSVSIHSPGNATQEEKAEIGSSPACKDSEATTAINAKLHGLDMADATLVGVEVQYSNDKLKMTVAESAKEDEYVDSTVVMVEANITSACTEENYDAVKATYEDSVHTKEGKVAKDLVVAHDSEFIEDNVASMDATEVEFNRVPDDAEEIRAMTEKEGSQIVMPQDGQILMEDASIEGSTSLATETVLQGEEALDRNEGDMCDSQTLTYVEVEDTQDVPVTCVMEPSLGCHYLVTRDVLEDEATMMMRGEEENVPSTEANFAEVIVENRGKSAMDLHVSQEGEFVIEDAPSVPVCARENDSYATPGEVEEIEATTEAKECEQMVAEDTKLDQPQEVDASLVELYSTTSITVEGDFTQDVSKIVLPESSKKHTSFESLKMPDEAELVQVQDDKKCDTMEGIFEHAIPTAEDELEKDLHGKPDNELVIEEASSVSIHSPGNVTQEEKEEIGSSLACKDSEATTAINAKLHGLEMVDASLVGVEGQYSHDKLVMTVAQSAKEDEYVDSSVVMVEANIISACTEGKYDAVKATYEDSLHTEEGKVAKVLVVAHDSEFVEDNVASMDATEVELNRVPDDAEEIRAMTEQEGSQIVMPQDGQILMEDASIEGSTSLATETVLQGEKKFDLNEGDTSDSQTLTYVGVEDTQDVLVTCVMQPSLGCHYLVTRDVLEDEATMMLCEEEENVPATETKFAEVIVQNRGKSAMDLHVSQEGEFVIEDAPSVPVYARENDSYATPGEVEEIEATTEAKECEQMVADDTKLDQPQEVDASLVELYSTTSITVEGDFTQDVSEIVLPESSKKHTIYESLKMPDEAELVLVQDDKKCDTVEAIFEDVIPTAEDELEKDLHGKPDNELVTEEASSVSIHSPGSVTQEEREEIGSSLACKDSEATTAINAKLHGLDMVDASLVGVEGQYSHNKLEMTVAESAKEDEYVDSSVVMVETNIISACTEENYDAVKATYKDSLHREEGKVAKDLVVAHDSEFVEDNVASMDATEVELNRVPDDAEEIRAMTEQEGSQIVLPQDGQILMEDASIEGRTSLATETVLQGEEKLDLNEVDTSDSQTLTYVGVEDTQDVRVTCVMQPSLGCHYLVTRDVLEDEATMMLREEEENVPSTETKFAEVIVENRGKSAMDLHVSQEGEFVIEDAPSVPVYARENDSYATPGEVEEIEATTEAKECEQMVADDTKLDQPQEVDASLMELYSTTSIIVEGDFTQDASEIVLPESSKKHTIYESLKMPDEAELVVVQEDKKCDTVEAIFEDVIPTAEDELEKDLHGKPDNELVIEEASSVYIHSPGNVTQEEKEEIGSSLACKDSEATTAINAKLLGLDMVDASLVGVEGQYSHDKLEITVDESAKEDEYVDSSVVMVEANIISACTEENYDAVKATYEDSLHREEGKVAKDLVVAHDSEFVEDNVASMDATEVELNRVPDDAEEIRAMTEQEGSQIVMPQDGQILMEDASIEGSTSLATETVLQGEEKLDLNEGDTSDSQTLTYVGVEDTQDVLVTCVMQPSLGCHSLVTCDVLEDEATMMLREEEENVPSTETKFAEVIVQNRGKSAKDLHVSQEGEFVIEDAPSVPVYARENDSYATLGEVEEIKATTDAKECEQMVADDTKLDQPQEVDASLVELYSTTSITVEGDFTQDVSEIVLPESSKKHTIYESLKMPDEAELVLVQEDKKCDTVEAIFEDVIPTAEDELEKNLHGKPDNELVIEEASSVSIHSLGNVTQEEQEEIGSSPACKDSEATTAINANLHGLDMADATLVGVEGQYSNDKLKMTVAESAKEDEYVDSSVVIVEANITSACTEENYDAVKATYEDSVHTEEGKVAKDLVVAHDSEFVEDNVASMDATEVEFNRVPDDAEEIRAMTEQEGSQIVMPQDGQILMEDASIEGNTSLATETVLQGEEALDLNEGDMCDSQTLTYVGVEDTQDVPVTCVMEPSLGCHYLVTRDVLEDEATMMLRGEEENVPSTETNFAEVIVENRGKSAMDLHVSQEGEFVIEDAPSVPVYARENDSYAMPGEVEEIEATTEAKECEQMVAEDTKLDQPQEVDASLVELYSTTSITVEGDFTQDVSEIVLPESSKKHTSFESLKMPDEAELVQVQDDKKCDTVEAIFEDVIPTAEDELEKDFHGKHDNELVIEGASSVSIHSPGNVTQEEKEEIGSSLACKDSEATTEINAKLNGLDMVDATLVGVEGQYSHDKLEMTMAESAKKDEYVDSSIVMVEANIISACTEENYDAVKATYEDSLHTEKGNMAKHLVVAHDSEFVEDNVASMDAIEDELNMVPEDAEGIRAMTEQVGSQIVMPQDGQILMEDTSIEGSTSLAPETVLQGEEALDLNEGEMCDSQTLTYVGVEDTQDVPVTCVMQPSLGWHYLVTRDVLEDEATMMFRGEEENVPSTETKFDEVIVENRGKSARDLHVSQEGEFVIEDAPSVPVYARENDSYATPGEVEEIEATTEAKECDQMVAVDTKLDQPQEVDASLVELYSTTSITVEGDFTQDVWKIVLPESNKKHTSFESLKMPDEAELVLVQEDKKCDTMEAIFEDVIPTAEDELEKDLHGKPDNELVIEEASSVPIHSPGNVTQEEKEQIRSSLACKDSEATTEINGKLHGLDMVHATLVGVEGLYSHDKLEMIVAESAKEDEYVDSSVVMVEANIISACTEENYDAVKATYEDSLHTGEGSMAKDFVVAHDSEFVEDNVASVDATEVELNRVPDDAEEIRAMTEQEGSQIVMPQDGQILMEVTSIEGSTSLAPETVLQGEEALDLNEGEMCDSQTLTYVGVEDTQDVPVTCVMQPSLGWHYLVTRDVLEDEATMMFRGEEENVPSTETKFDEVIVENRGKSARDMHVSQEGEFVIEDAPSVPIYAQENDSYATPGEVEEIEATTEAKECEQMVADDTKLDQPQEVDASLVELYSTTSITVEGDFTQDVSEIVLPESSKKHTSFESLKMPDEAELVLVKEDKKCDTVEAIFEDVIPTAEDELEKDLHGKPNNELVIEEASSVSIHSPGNVTQEEKEEIGSSLACKDSEATTDNAKLNGLDMVDATLVRVEWQYSHDKLEMTVAESAKEDEYVDSSVVMVEANIISACTEENYDAVKATYEDSLHTEEGNMAKDFVVAQDSEFVEDNVPSMDATAVELNMVPDDAEEIRAMMEQEGSQIVMPQDGQILMEDASIEGSTSLATETVLQGEEALDLNEGDMCDSQILTYVGVEETQDVPVTCVMEPSLGCQYLVTRDVLEDEATMMLREEEENVPSTETKFAEVIVENRGKSAMDLHVSQVGEFVIEDAPSDPVYARENDSYATLGEVEEIEATTEAKECEQMVADDTKLDQPQEVDASMVELYSTTSITVEGDFTQVLSEIVLPESSMKHTSFESLKIPDEAELVLVQEDKKSDSVEATFKDVIPTTEDELEKDLHEKPDNELVIEEASSVSIHSPGNVTLEEKEEIGSSLSCKGSEATTAINAKLHGLDMVDATLVGVEGQYSHDKLEMTVAKSGNEDEYVDSSVVIVEANIISACTEENYDAVKVTYEKAIFENSEATTAVNTKLCELDMVDATLVECAATPRVAGKFSQDGLEMVVAESSKKDEYKDSIVVMVEANIVSVGTEEIIKDTEDDDNNNDGEEEGLNSSALASHLKPITITSRGGNITATSQDTSIFSVDRPAGLGSSAPSLRSTATLPPSRSSISGPSELEITPKPIEAMTADEKKLHEKLELIRVKFLRLVCRMGATPEESVAAQVLYRLSLAEGIHRGRVSSLENAWIKALQQEAESREELSFSCNILVLGKTGVGKSATINSIFGEEKSKTNAFDASTTNVREISGSVDGIQVHIIDTPGLRTNVMDQGWNKKILSAVKSYTKKCPPDVILYVDRLDSWSCDDDVPLLKTITATLGTSVWLNAIVTLTHAASAPPDSSDGDPVTYETMIAQRSHIIQQSIRQAASDMLLMNPVALVENHPYCQRNRQGQMVLPNGQAWRNQLLLLCYSTKTLSEANSLVKLQDPSPREHPAFGFRSLPLPFLLSSLLQPRSHPKLSAHQGGDEEDSDVDLDDYSDICDDEDEYDRLPPFRPLTKAQFQKLTKDQKNEYLDEHDYWVKLLQRKQWKGWLQRLKEIKKRGKAEKDSCGYGNMAGDNDQDPPPENVAVPLPDMVLPPSFDSDDPTYRYRFLEPTSTIISRPILDVNAWDHDCGFDGVSLEDTLAIAREFPAAVSVQLTKDKKELTIHLDSSISGKHGENASSLAGFDVQTVRRQLAYVLRGETKFKNIKKNKTTGGFSLTFLGDTMATGVKVEDQLSVGKCLSLVASTGAMRAQGDTAYGANLEARLKDKDYPINRFMLLLGLSLMKWRGDLALGANMQSQFSVGRGSKMALHIGLNNKLSGKINVKMSTSEQVQMALLGLVPLAASIYKSFHPAEA